MREIWLVCRRELMERVVSRAFLIGTLLVPVFFAAITVLPILVEGGGEERRVVVVDETTSGVGDALAARLGRPPEDEDANRYFVEVVRGDAESLEGDLNVRVATEEIDGYLIVPADLFESNRLRYQSTSIASPGMLRDVQVAASEGVRAERLRRAGIDMTVITEAIRPVSVQNVRIGSAGEVRGGVESTFILAYVLAFAIYMMVFLYGVHVMRSVLEEKTSRIAEVLVSSIRSTNLMAGKILGVAGAAVLQVAIWAGIGALLATQVTRFTGEESPVQDILGELAVDPLTATLFFAYFMLGFFLYAALFAALGASVTTEQEAQSFQVVFIIPLMIPLLFLIPLTTEPMGRAATVLGMVPFTSPVAMPMRLAAGEIPALQVVVSLLVLIASLVACAWLAGKIYRIGILATGKRPGIRDLARWVRMA